MMAASNRLVTRIASGMGWVALLFLAFMMLAITIDVIARALVGKPIPGLFEMSVLSMVMVVFMGLGLTQIDDAHIRVTMLTDRMPSRLSRKITALASVFAATALSMLAWPASVEASYSFAIREFYWGSFQMPIWWAKIALAASLWFGAFQAFLHALLLVSGPSPERSSDTSDTNRT